MASDNNDSKTKQALPEAFDDILFNSPSEDDLSESSLQSAEAIDSTSFSSDESFDDILFADQAAAEKIIENVSSERKQSDLSDKTFAHNNDNAVKAKLNTNPSKVAPAKNTDASIETVMPSADDVTEISGFDKTQPGESLTQDYPNAIADKEAEHEDALFLEDALFSSDAELIAASDAELPADDLPAATQDSSPFSHNDKAGIKHNVDQQSAHSAHSGQPASNFQYLNLQSTSFIRAAADSAVSSEANKTSETREASPDSANFEESSPSGVIPSATRKPSLHVLNNSHCLQTVAKKTFINKPKPEPQIEQHQPNTESSKAKLFASKAKHNLSDMLGAELPDREISLDFKFSLQKGKKELGDLPSKKEIEKYLAQKGASFNQILKHSDRDISLIAKYKLSPNDRLRLLSLFLPFFFAKAQQLAISFERKAFDAKNTSRLEQLSLSQSSIKGLISGYKQIYAELYALNNFQYKRLQAQANQVAFHLCLLLCLEQRLLFASKAKVSAHSIKTFNKLATVLRHYEPDEFNAVRKCVTEKTPRSIAQLWTKYQLLLCFDSSDIATGLQPQLIAYLDQQLLNQIQLVLPEDIDYLDASQYLILNENHDCRPSLLDLSDTSNEQVQLKLNALKQRDSQSGDYCFIAVDNLFNQIKHDFSKQLAILENQHNFDNQPIDALKKLQISANFFASMNKYVTGIEQDLKKSSYSLVLNQQIEVRLGITAIQDYIESLMKRIDEESSQRSTAEQNKPAKFGFRDWSIASEQQGLLYLQTQLSANTPALDCGELILLTRSNEQGYNHQLAIIESLDLSEIQRPRIIATIIADDFAVLNTFALLQETESNQHPASTAMCLLNDSAAFFLCALPLLCSNAEAYSFNFYDGQSLSVRPAQMLQLQREFALYSL